MECNNCKKNVSIKETTQWISLLCRCQITIIYPNNKIKTITKQEYLQQKKEN